VFFSNWRGIIVSAVHHSLSICLGIECGVVIASQPLPVKCGAVKEVAQNEARRTSEKVFHFDAAVERGIEEGADFPQEIR
jgi:hypothetical protein